MIQAQPGPQTILQKSACRDIFFGGARGGGKTYGTVLHFIAKAHLANLMYGPNKFNGVYIRTVLGQMSDLLDVCKSILTPFYGKWRGSKFQAHENGPLGGATLRFAFIDNEYDANNLAGASLQWMCVEELQNFRTLTMVDRAHGILRSVSGKQGIEPYFLATGNPGGRSHSAIKKRYIDASIIDFVPFTKIEKLGSTEMEIERVYMPSRMKNNPLLHPSYLKNLFKSASGNEAHFIGQSEGRWDINYDGGMFDDVYNPEIHVIPHFPIPSNWEIMMSYDYGDTSPFSIGFWAIANGETVKLPNGEIRNYPKNTMFRVAEWYGKVPDTEGTGLRMGEPDIVKGVMEIERKLGIKATAGPADLQIFGHDKDGPELITFWKKEGYHWKKADKSRGSRINGCQLIRIRLKNSLKERMEDPGLFIFKRCTAFTEHFPTATQDPKRPGDMEAPQDHIHDETRYAVSHIETRIRKPSEFGTRRNIYS